MNMQKVLFRSALGFLLFSLLSFVVTFSSQAERKVIISSKAEKVYSLIADFRTGWGQWCAFDAAKNNKSYMFYGPNIGAGAARSWNYDSLLSGHQIISDSVANESIDYEISFLKIFFLQGKIHLRPFAEGTEVTWTNLGQQSYNPITRWFGFLTTLIFESDFDESLRLLKTVAESKSDS